MIQNSYNSHHINCDTLFKYKNNFILLSDIKIVDIKNLLILKNNYFKNQFR